MTETKFAIGRQQGLRIEHAFDIERLEDGGVRLTKIAPSMTDAERQAVLLAFGSPQKTDRPVYPKGTKIWGTERVTLQPGTPDHFRAAVYNLPVPFIPMSVGG